MRYIDVSEHNGVIDWEEVKGCIDGCLLRAGYGAGHIDRQFERNVRECSRLGIPCGAYWFSYAWTPDMAAREAAALLAAVEPWPMALPLCFDFEYDSVAVAAREGGVTVDRALATALVRAFCEAVEAGGHWALFYANPDFLARYFEADLPRRFGLWLAQWPGGQPDVASPPRPCAMWQWTSAGSVPGIAGPVDVSEAYTDFAAQRLPLRQGELSAKLTEGMESAPAATTPPSPAGDTSPYTGEAARAAGAGVPDGPDGPFAAAVAWARDAGILPEGVGPADSPTLAAVAEMFYQFDKLP